MRARATTTNAATRATTSAVRAPRTRRARRATARDRDARRRRADGDDDDASLGEASLADVVERLRRAEEERERLRAALEAKSGGAGTAKTVDELARETPRAGRRAWTASESERRCSDLGARATRG